jgi:pyruvate-formate lyase
MQKAAKLSQFEANSGGALSFAHGKVTRPTERVARIKKRLVQHQRQIDIERARYTTEIYRQTEGQPMAIRRAKMLLHLVRRLSITVQADELIVGNRSLLPRMGVIAPEGAVDWVDQELEILSTRPQDRNRSENCAMGSSHTGAVKPLRAS